jgi:hypothetical protein
MANPEETKAPDRVEPCAVTDDPIRTQLSCESFTAGEQSPPRNLERETLNRYVTEIDKTIKDSNSLFGYSPSDSQKLERILAPLSENDRREIERLYDGQKGIRGALRYDLQKTYGHVEGTRLSTILDRPDGRTSDAGAFTTAIARLHKNPQQGNADLAYILKSMTSAQISQMDTDLKAQFGTQGLGIKELLGRETDLSPTLREAIFGKDGNGGLLLKGTDNRTTGDIITLAKLAVQNSDKELFLNVISGSLLQTRAARNVLRQDGKFMESLASTFPGSILSRMNPLNTNPEDWMDNRVRDFMRDGHTSLETLIDQNHDQGWLNKNFSVLKLSFQSATQEERDKYSPQFMEKFGRLGSPAEVSELQDLFLNGRPTLISEMASTHKRSVVDIFGWGSSSHTTQDLMSKVENISEADWRLLRDPEKGKNFMDLIDSSLSRYASRSERTEIMSYIQQIANTENFKDVRNIGRDTTFAIIDNTRSNLMSMIYGKHDVPNIMKRFENMSPTDAAERKEYKDYLNTVRNARVGENIQPDERMRHIIEKQQVVDQFISSLGAIEKTHAMRLLKEVERTGVPPKLTDFDKVISNYIQGTSPRESLKQIERTMQEPALRERLQNLQNNQDHILKWIIERQVRMSSEPFFLSNTDAIQPRTKSILSNLYNTGQFSLTDKISLGYSRRDIVEAAVKAPAQERNQAEVQSFLRPQEREVMEKATKDQAGNLSLTDRMRLFIVTGVGSPKEFENELKLLSNDDKQKLRDDYAKKYDGSINDHFLALVKDRGQLNLFTTYLTPSFSDGRQAAYDNHEAAISAQSIMGQRGPELMLTRAAELHDALKEKYPVLSPQQQQEMNALFGASHKEMLASKEKVAQTGGILIAATLMSTGVAPVAAIAAALVFQNIAEYFLKGERDYDVSEISDKLFDAVVQTTTAFALGKFTNPIGRTGGAMNMANWKATMNAFLITTFSEKFRERIQGSGEDKIPMDLILQNAQDDLVKFYDRLEIIQQKRAQPR